MIQWIVIVATTAAAGLMMMGGSEPPPPAAPAAQDVTCLSDALVWVGGCSVVCSLIGGSTLIYITKHKPKPKWKI